MAPLPIGTQSGSASIRMGRGFGAAPSKRTIPVIVLPAAAAARPARGACAPLATPESASTDRAVTSSLRAMSLSRRDRIAAPPLRVHLGALASYATHPVVVYPAGMVRTPSTMMLALGTSLPSFALPGLDGKL